MPLDEASVWRERIIASALVVGLDVKENLTKGVFFPGAIPL